MSGGAFNYAYLDSQRLRHRLGRMVRFAHEHEYPPEAAAELAQAESALERLDNYQGLLWAIEWHADGDIGRGRALELINGNG